MQRTASSSSLGSSSENPAEDKKGTSLIDFDADTVPPVNPAVPQTQPATTSPFVGQPTNTSSNDQNWASFDFGTEIKVSQPSSSVNSLESVLSQLSMPASIPAAQTPLLPKSDASPVVSLGQISVSPFSGGTPAAATVSNFSPVPTSGAGQWPGVPHQQPSFFPATGGPSTAQSFTSVSGASSNQVDLFCSYPHLIMIMVRSTSWNCYVPISGKQAARKRLSCIGKGHPLSLPSPSFLELKLKHRKVWNDVIAPKKVDNSNIALNA